MSLSRGYYERHPSETPLDTAFSLLNFPVYINDNGRVTCQNCNWDPSQSSIIGRQDTVKGLLARIEIHLLEENCEAYL